MEALVEEFESERVAGDIDMYAQDHSKSRKEDVWDPSQNRNQDGVKDEEEEDANFVRIERAARTDTEGTLVACDDDDDDDDNGGADEVDEKGRFEVDFSLGV